MKKTTIEKELLDAAELGEHLGFSKRTIQQWARDKKISVIKISATCYRYHLPTVMSDLRRLQSPALGRRNRHDS